MRNSHSFIFTKDQLYVLSSNQEMELNSFFSGAPQPFEKGGAQAAPAPLCTGPLILIIRKSIYKNWSRISFWLFSNVIFDHQWNEWFWTSNADSINMHVQASKHSLYSFSSLKYIFYFHKKCEGCKHQREWHRFVMLWQYKICKK